VAHVVPSEAIPPTSLLDASNIRRKRRRTAVVLVAVFVFSALAFDELLGPSNNISTSLVVRVVIVQQGSSYGPFSILKRNQEIVVAFVLEISVVVVIGIIVVATVAAIVRIVMFDPTVLNSVARVSFGTVRGEHHEPRAAIGIWHHSVIVREVSAIALIGFAGWVTLDKRSLEICHQCLVLFQGVQLCVHVAPISVVQYDDLVGVQQRVDWRLFFLHNRHGSNPNYEIGLDRVFGYNEPRFVLLFTDGILSPSVILEPSL